MKKLAVYFFQNLSLRNKLILIYTVFVSFIILIIGMLTYQISVRQLEESEKNLLLQNLKQTGSLVDFNLEMYLRKGEMIFSNTIIQNALGKDYTNTGMNDIFETYQNMIYRNIEPIMQDLVYPELTLKASERGIGTDMVKVIIYSSNQSLPKDGGVMREMEEINNQPWVSEMRRFSKKPYWRGIFTHSSNAYISVNRILVSYENLKELGVASIMVPELRLKYLLAQNNEKSNVSIFLVDSAHHIVTTKTSGTTVPGEKDISQLISKDYQDREGITTTVIGGEKYIFSHTTSDITGWKLIALYPYQAITQRVQIIKYAVMILLVAGLLVSALINILTAYATTRRLNKIKRKMNLVKKDRHTKLDIIPGNDEIGQLDRHFNDMIETINTLIEKENHTRLQKAALQVELLQSQINPHILYNTLSTIQWRAKKAGIDDVGVVTERLIRFFRNFLNRGSLMSGIQQELDTINQFIDILKFTYNMDFDVLIDVENQVLRYYSLNMFLQPIVENAIIHGLRPSGRKGSLEIRGRLDGDTICFTVWDNGVGMEEKMVRELNEGKFIKRTGGFGITNVMKRIGLYFGDGYGITVQSVLDSGTKISILLPALPTDEVEPIGDS